MATIAHSSCKLDRAISRAVIRRINLMGSSAGWELERKEENADEISVEPSSKLNTQTMRPHQNNFAITHPVTAAASRFIV